MILTGVLNLRNRTFGTAAPGVRWAATAASAVTTAFGALAGADRALALVLRRQAS